MCVRVPATHDATQRRQDARVLAIGALGAPWPQGGAGDGSAAGELDAQGRARAEALARSISGHAGGYCQRQLFEGDEPKRRGSGKARWGSS